MWGTMILTTFLTTYFLILPAITIENSKAEEAVIKVETTSGSNSSNAAADQTDSANINSESSGEVTSQTTQSETTTVAEDYFEGDLIYKADGYTVKVGIKKDAKLPKSTTLTVTELTEEQSNYSNYKDQALSKVEKTESDVKAIKLYDIKLYDGETEIQPQAKVTVEVTYDQPIVDTTAETPEIVHFKDSGELEVLKSKSDDETKNIESDIAFQTGSFSIYAIVLPDGTEVPRATYHFENADGSVYYFMTNTGQQTDIQIIKNGEALGTVGIPIVDGTHEFNGWYLYDKTTNTYGEKVVFDDPISVTETKDIYVRPSFGEVAYVTLYEDTAGTIILEKNQVNLENGTGTVDLTQYSVPSPSSNMIFAGWSETIGGTAISESESKAYTVTENKNLYPVFKKSLKIEFNTGDIKDGASYVAPKSVIEGESAAIAKPTDPTRPGYTFAGWYTAETGGTEFDFSSVITKNTTLYAHWTAANSSYTVIYWQQAVTDDKNATAAQKTYDYAGQETRSGTTGTTVSITSTDKIPKETGFEYTTDKGESSVTVKADGSSVINIYFNRKLITMQFNTYSTNNTYSHLSWGYSNYTTTYTGLYGSTLASNGYSWLSGYAWRYFNSANGMTGMSYLGEFILPSGVMDSNGTLIRMIPATSKTNEYHFYKQNLDGTYPTTPNDTGIGAGATTFSFSEKYAGFTVKQSRRVYSSGYAAENWQSVSVGDSVSMIYNYNRYNYYYNLEVRYERLSYKINYLDPFTNQELSNVPSKYVKYEESISSYKPDSSITPVASKPGYRFTGKWYKDAAMTQEIDWSTTMPSHDLKVYAGFEKIKYNVTIDPNGGELSSTEATYFNVEYGDKITEYTDISRNYIADSNGLYYYRYDTNDGVTTTRVARYTTDSTEPNVSLKTTYRFEQDAYKLVGWYQVLADGTLKPYNFSSAVVSDVTLRAIWRRVGEYQVVYDTDAVGLDGNPIEDDSGNAVNVSDVPTDGSKYDDGSHFALLNRPTIPSGYRFRGWYYNEKVYSPRDQVTLDALLADPNKKVHVKPVLIPISSLTVEDTFLTYDGNGGTNTGGASSVTIPHLNLNSTVQAEDADFFTRTGYDLIGWNENKEQADAGAVQYTPGTEIGLDNNYDDDSEGSDNILYAVWKPKTYTITVTKNVKGTEKDKTTKFTFEPSDSLQQENFSLADTETKTFTVPYGTQFTIAEQDYADFDTVETITHKNLASGEADKTAEGDSSQTVTVDGDIDLVFTNTRNRQTLSIQKVNVENLNESLSGAQFTIYKIDENGNRVQTAYTDITSREDGFVQTSSGVIVLNAAVGEYYLSETKAPDGYLLPDEDIKVVVTSTGVSMMQNGQLLSSEEVTLPDGTVTTNFKITNSKGTELPSTGGIGERVFIIAGLTMIIPAAALLYRKRRFT
ncbi:InlB B-repeat-containing protein [Streptococcus caprae]|uniref:InlB B-repeat-containing protein n=1 Tax=Streptococcus caprae TaxID=1640501 RepID=A0ABV8CUZ8_9STRE